MEPQIQYAKTKDGVSIAYWTMGEGGTPLVHLVNIPWSHIQLEWENQDRRPWYERLAEQGMLVRYDARGTGLSERHVADFSLDTLLLDLEAVVDRLALSTFALFGYIGSGALAIAYAARHPERVRRLLLWDTPPRRPSDVLYDVQVQAMRGLAVSSWKTFTETYAHMGMGWSEGEAAHRYAQYMRECVTPETAALYFDWLLAVDVEDLLPQVRSPTLVLRRRRGSVIMPDWVMLLASKIPDARLSLLEGEAGAPYLGDTDAVLATLADFLAEDAPTGASSSLPSGMTAILFLDIVDSTALTTKLGDAVYREKERALDASIRSAITEAGGTPVEGKVLGDGVMAVFTSARQAIDAAQRCRDLGNEAGLPLHLGVHAGDVVREGNNVHGGAVQMASRVQSVAAPGEILVSATVRDLARTSAGVAFEDRGEHELKGITEPQRLFAVSVKDGSDE